MSYKSFEVFDIRDYVDLSGAMGLPREFPFDMVRPDGAHPFMRYFLASYPGHRMVFRCMFDQLSTFAVVRDFFIARKGSLGSFWLISPCKDWVLVESLSGGDVTIKIRHVGYNQHFVASTGTFRFLVVSDGTTENYRKINSAVDSETNGDTLTLDSALTLGATLKEDVVLHFLFFVRFDQDVLSADWESPDSCFLALTMRELPGDYPT